MEDTRGAAVLDQAQQAPSAPAACNWRGQLLCPCATKEGEEDCNICCYATCCPCTALGETYLRALNLPPWTVPVHAIVWFFAISACWIAAASIDAACVELTRPSFPRPPPGVNMLTDLRALQRSNYTMGANGKNLTNVFWNGTATAAFARKIDKANADGRAIAACEARLSPTVGGVFILTLAMLFYTIWRRGQIRRALLLPGDLTMDFVLWLFCTQCVLCQEYRTMRRNHVLEGKWAAGNSWLLDFTSSQATNTKAPAYVEMV